jgi:hypothetical protein
MPPLFRRPMAALFQVTTGTKNPRARVAQNDVTHVAGIFDQRAPRIEQIQPHSWAFRVAHLLPVQHNLQQAVDNYLRENRFKLLYDNSNVGARRE